MFHIAHTVPRYVTPKFRCHAALLEVGLWHSSTTFLASQLTQTYPEYTPRSDLTYFLRLRRKAELEIVSSLEFATLNPPFLAGNASHHNPNLQTDLLQAWSSLEKGPMIIPYLIAKLSAFLPPLVSD